MFKNLIKKYKGFIKKSRTYDSIALSQLIDVIAPIYMMLKPEDLGISIVAYAVIRIIINFAQVRLRAKTTGPVGQK